MNHSTILPWHSYILLALLLRCSISLWKYSGQSVPPMYGDFEAQRHWMEVTSNLPPSQWYENNTAVNNLSYWGLDYPPLTAYHSYLMGMWASKRWNATWMALQVSHGFESTQLKVFMRLTVILSDCFTFIPACVVFFLYALKKSVITEDRLNMAALIATLFHPTIILIDHGHFQYNCVSLGLFIFAVSSYVLGRFILGSTFFCLALFHKQMELYHALPIFVYVLSAAKHRSNNKLECTWFLCKQSLLVISFSLVICLPYLTNPTQVLRRLFPVGRGVYEDNVSNFWCTIRPILKLLTIQQHEKKRQYMVAICGLATSVSVFPSLYQLMWRLRGRTEAFLLCLVTCSLGFYLFSYQVHEKSILLVVIPVSLSYPILPTGVFEIFSSTALLSMWPLLIKDCLAVPTLAILSGSLLMWRYLQPATPGLDTRVARRFWRTSEQINIMILLFFAGLCSFVEPPTALPFLFPYLLSCYCCFVFFLCFFGFHLILFALKPDPRTQKPMFTSPY